MRVVSEDDRTQEVYADLIRGPDAAEALAWLQEVDKREQRTISGGCGSEDAWIGEEAVAIVQELYGLGAVRVTAVEIQGRVEHVKHQDTATLIVELPEAGEQRACLFAWAAGFARGTGWAPTPDEGREYLLVWRD